MKRHLILPRKVAVIGGAGYIGGILVRKLLARGLRVTVLDRLDFGGDSLRACLPNPYFELVVGDLRDWALVEQAARGAHLAVHLAALVGDAACSCNPAEATDINVDGAAETARICRRLEVPRFLLSSTCSVYGSSVALADETSPLTPVSHYAETKIAAESEVLTMRTRDFHPTVLRIGTAFGLAPRPRFDLVVNLLAARAYFEGRAEIFNPERWRPFVHVSDIARAFDAVARAPIGVISGDTFNVGDSNMNLRMADLAIALTTCFPEARISEQSHPDRRNYRVSFDKIARTIGFRATVGVEQGIRELRAAFLNGEISDYRFPSYHNHHAPPSRAAIASTGAYETAASPAGR